MQDNKQISRLFWRRYLGARGYFVTTSGNITYEVIMDYISNQHENDKDNGDFTIVD